jgi:hypothetical protein
MTEASDKFFAAAAIENKTAVNRGIRVVRDALNSIEVSLDRKALAADRIVFLRQAQDGLGLVIAADGRQTLVEDAKQNSASFAVLSPPVLVKTRQSLTEDLRKTALELTKYSEDENEDTNEDDYDDDEDSDDPPAAAAPPPEQFGIFLRGSGQRSASFPDEYLSKGAAEFAIRYSNPVGPGSSLARTGYEVRAL